MNPTWTLQTDPNSDEQYLLTECIHRMQGDLMNGFSRGSAKGQANGPNTGNQTKGSGGKGTSGAKTPAQPGASATVPPVPQPFLSAHMRKQPAICMHFAYFGTCTRQNATKTGCTSQKKLPLLHTCALCGFKNGVHPIKDGKNTQNGGQCP